ncbi:MAG TPA: metalloregulator ArsR/SmtB family transcription factor [Phycisphaerae bacterium]|nr:metalloregulator ArsR/SmtB family transcription factor [Phycisphaerae bacterium]
MPETSSKTGPHGADQFIELLRTLADPIRLRMLRLLETQPHNSTGGLSVGELGEILKLPQSTVSRHLKTLTEAHLADARREGTSMFYRLAENGGTNGNGGGVVKQLRTLARSQLENDPLAKTDTQRLAAVLRKREPSASTAESFFGKNAPHWDQLRAQWFGDTFHLEALLALLNPDWTIADIGTGTGAMLPLLAPHVNQILAIDPNSAMLRNAKTRARDLNLSNIDFRLGAAEALPIDKATVDVALIALVLAYTTDPAAALREVHRILKPGGAVLIIDLQPHTVELFREKLNHRWMGFSQNQLTQWLTAAGFTSIRWHPLPAKAARSEKSNGTPVPDLFVLRAQSEGDARD